MPIRTPSGMQLTYEDYARIPDDGQRHEIVDGQHFVSPAPTPPHQRISRWIQFQLFEALEKTGRAQVINAPIDVELSRFDVVQPDIVVIAAERAGIVGDRKIDGPPDLVVEILSASTREHDRVRKKAAYERPRVPEYWIVDPVQRHVERFVLAGDRYADRGVATQTIAPLRFDDVTVDLTRVW